MQYRKRSAMQNCAYQVLTTANYVKACDIFKYDQVDRSTRLLLNCPRETPMSHLFSVDRDVSQFRVDLDHFEAPLVPSRFEISLTKCDFPRIEGRHGKLASCFGHTGLQHMAACFRQQSMYHTYLLCQG